MYACAHLQFYMIISPADQKRPHLRIRAVARPNTCISASISLRRCCSRMHSRLTCAPRAPRTLHFMRHAASAVLQSCLSLSSPFPSVIPFGISTKLFMCLRLLSRRILSYFNLHFYHTIAARKSLITAAGEYFPESFNILRRSSPWSWPISISRKPSGFQEIRGLFHDSPVK